MERGRLLAVTKSLYFYADYHCGHPPNSVALRCYRSLHIGLVHPYSPCCRHHFDHYPRHPMARLDRIIITNQERPSGCFLVPKINHASGF